MNRIKESLKNSSFALFFWYMFHPGFYKKSNPEYYLKTVEKKIVKWKKKNKAGAFLVLTPAHGNLGDHAIVTAEILMLKELNISYYEISGADLFLLEKYNKLNILNGFLIMFNGGGYLGTLWYHDERVVRNTIISNPDSKIILFPNTAFYENTDFGKEEFEKAKNIYNGHKNLKIYTREKYSFNLLKQIYSDVYLVPDMVMSLKIDDATFERNGVSICLRNDREKTITDTEVSVINDFAKKHFSSLSEIDTVVPRMIPLEKREEELSRIFNQFLSSELVITDRLHGMIFAAITGTPCIVINSKSPKVKGCYEWIKDNEYIAFCDNLDEIENIYSHLPRGSQKYDNSNLLPLYDTLKKDLIN